MLKLKLIGLIAGATAAGWAFATTAAPAEGLRETPPFFAPQLAFSYRGKRVPDTGDQPECRSQTEVESYFDALREGAGERGIPAETIVEQQGLDANRFIHAAWSEKGELPFAGDYIEVDLVVVRTRPDLPGFAKIHFGSHKLGFICNFAHPVIITSERARYGLLGEGKPKQWRRDDPYPGMSDSERDAFKMLFGLRNQLNRGNPEEQDEAMRGLGELFRSPDGRADKPYPSDLPPFVAPKPRPQFEPTPKDVERDMQPRPRCSQAPFAYDCIPGR